MPAIEGVRSTRGWRECVRDVSTLSVMREVRFHGKSMGLESTSQSFEILFSALLTFARS